MDASSTTHRIIAELSLARFSFWLLAKCKHANLTPDRTHATTRQRQMRRGIGVKAFKAKQQVRKKRGLLLGSFAAVAVADQDQARHSGIASLTGACIVCLLADPPGVYII